jgi:hypothetical protein
MQARRTATQFFRPQWILAFALVVGGGGDAAGARRAARRISIVRDAAPGRAAGHGLAKLEAALRARAIDVELPASAAVATGDRLVIVGACAGEGEAARAARAAGVAVPHAPQSLAIKTTTIRAKPALILCGADDVGVMYAALDAAERVSWPADGAANPLSAIRDMTEQPTVVDRSLSMYTMNRAYWESRFYDDAYWTRYLDMLAADRFNRLLIVFGYENGGFLAPPYPYFFDTPGFPGVHMHDLTAEQQQKNLTALNRLIEMSHDRGIAVTVGIWDHIYRAGVQTGGADWLAEYQGRPVPNTVEGVTTDNLNDYTLASLEQLLKSVPALDAIQFRVHEESGLKPAEMEGFWRVVFARVQQVKPGMLLEARAKGTPDAVIEAALVQGVNLRIETKYWMEQMGLPFHPIHVNPPDQQSRRHGYADLLRYPQRYQLNWRLWNGGTARVLLSGDPEYVRRYSASTSLYNSPNWDVSEPLATKMEAQRPDAVPFDLMPVRFRSYDYEFERYWYFYRVWGRVGYRSGTPADVWQHEFDIRFGAAARDVEAGINRASQVLPMIVAAVYPYSQFPMTRGWAERQPLGASLMQYARNEGSDVELFESFQAAAKRIAAHDVTAKRTPEATSSWLSATADSILASVARAERAIGTARGAEFETTMTDLRILSSLARFHARRSLAAVQYNLFTITHDSAAIDAAIAGERSALDAWRGIVAAAGDQYTFSLAMGACNFSLCGHWRDEVPKLEAGLASLERQRAGLPRSSAAGTDAAAKSAAIASNSPDHLPPSVQHERIRTAQAGQPLTVTGTVTDPSGVRSVRLRFRPVTQFEEYQTLEMVPTAKPNTYAATIPGMAVSPTWDFMYFIEAIDRVGNGAMWPDFLKESPYVIVKVRR